jgi:hypothetical protein
VQGWTLKRPAPEPQLRKDKKVKGNVQKPNKARPAPNKSKIELPKLGQDNVLPALHKTLCKAQGINKKLPELIADCRKSG